MITNTKFILNKSNPKIKIPKALNAINLNKLKYTSFKSSSFADCISSTNVSYITDGGLSNDRYASHYWSGLRPVIVLKTKVKVLSGEGTISNPYSIGI